MTYSLGTLQLGTIKKERPRADAQLFEQPMPGSSANNTILIDLFGVVKEITLEGNFISGTGGLTIKQFTDQFIDNSTGKIKGNQTTLSYSSDTMTNSINVIIKSFEYSYDEAEPTRISYVLTIQEGTSS